MVVGEFVDGGCGGCEQNVVQGCVVDSRCGAGFVVVNLVARYLKRGYENCYVLVECYYSMRGCINCGFGAWYLVECYWCYWL